MALIVEDGTIVTNANSYVSIADADSYHSARGNDDWTGTDAEKEEAILRAMRFIEAQPWKGKPTQGPVSAVEGQPLEWPRNEVYVDGFLWPTDEIPQQVVNALCEAALVELEDPDALGPELERGGSIKREKVDVIETEYFETASARTTYDKILQPMHRFLTSPNAVQLGRG